MKINLQKTYHNIMKETFPYGTVKVELYPNVIVCKFNDAITKYIKYEIQIYDTLEQCTCHRILNDVPEVIEMPNFFMDLIVEDSQ